MNYDEGLFHEILDFAEEHLIGKSENKAYLYPRVNNLHKEPLIKVLCERGYSYSGKDEADSSIEITDKLTSEIPKEYKLELANRYEASVRALAHGRAFSRDSQAIQALMNQRTRAYKGLGKSPDYNENLDLCLVDHNNEIAAFATFWFDDKNLIGLLEPLGTVSGYQKRGLGKVLVYEGMKRLRQLGATKLHVGSIQPFYKKIGFNVESLTEIWQKEFQK
jgi:predicted N-acetyltransferase YhbS